MLIDNRVFETYTAEFNHPFTDEDWEKLEDVDFDHTEHVWFHTKNGKEVHFYKNAIPIEWIRNELSKYEYVNRLEYSYCGKNGVEVLTTLLKDWEKENGKAD